jgi:hypothetical protein
MCLRQWALLESRLHELHCQECEPHIKHYDPTFNAEWYAIHPEKPVVLYRSDFQRFFHQSPYDFPLLATVDSAGNLD